ncbi:hypothetical protein PYW08_007402 [Mythimna loreyi]|uniref:Uncharacterized protein n=1 Tax=Mythimna loreyi TaxID=667449 RepID=A0ACC2QBM9_9NEOP|nr:hypothetical protein PYW08_007402 [Mythimna loreyi]
MILVYQAQCGRFAWTRQCDNVAELSRYRGGPAKKIILTPLQERLYNILGRDIGEPLPGVRHNPLTPTVTIPLVDASPTSVNLENNSFSLLENYEVPVVMPDELVVNIPPTQEISLDQENVDPQPSTSNQNPRRKRQRSRRYAAEDGDHAALEAAQSRLEAIEARNAEATLKHAEATLQHAEAVNNLAAAITQQTSTTAKMVDLLDRFMTSVSKKKFRRILLSSDSESD